jgi:hypothetical protein
MIFTAVCALMVLADLADAAQGGCGGELGRIQGKRPPSRLTVTVTP